MVASRRPLYGEHEQHQEHYATLSVALYPTASRFFVSRTFLNRRGMRFALAWTSIHERFAPIGAKVPKTQDVFCFSMAHRRFYHKHCGYDGAACRNQDGCGQTTGPALLL